MALAPGEARGGIERLYLGQLARAVLDRPARLQVHRRLAAGTDLDLALVDLHAGCARRAGPR
ncbi:hypothetical protein G3435_23925 [Pseudomonas sp. MAFF212428]|uniref:Uncharacterized protein n=1 Tax=Pseudomonas brassicae TaxID=2708063 RepID=A0A6M0D311_9PSED|nr:hypothetical protein [Pseudomonas brassicae]